MSALLLLQRHATAAAVSSGHDADRPLTAQGQDEAERMAGWLAALRTPPLRLVTSPALRCRETAAVMARGLSPAVTVAVDAGLALDATSTALLATARAAGSGSLLVSHAPSLTVLAAALLDPCPVGFSFPPAGIAGLRARPEGWDLSLVLRPADLGPPPARGRTGLAPP